MAPLTLRPEEKQAQYYDEVGLRRLIHNPRRRVLPV